MRRCLPWLPLVLAACAAPQERPRAAADAPAIQAAAAALTSFVRAGWHLPVRVQAHLSDASDAAALTAEQAAREEALVVQQLEEVREAYAHAAFDLFEVAVTIDAAARAPGAALEGPLRRLVVRLPRPADDAAAPVAAHALIEAMGDAFAWDAVGRWYEGEADADLLAALRRDLGKLDRLEEQLALECRRLELVSAALDARAAATGHEPMLTPSEATFARGAQHRATFALHRVLNTLARWRAAGRDDDLPRRDAARLVLLRARHVHEAYLTWLLDVVVGERPVLEVWQRAWWHRHPLYRTLDARGPLDFVDQGDAPPGTIPAGSVRALLRLRYGGDLGRCYDEVDAVTATGPAGALAGGPLAAEAAAARQGVTRCRALLERHRFGAFAAWKETWDARLKAGFTYPFYAVVAQVACFLGDTRTTSRPPAIDPALADGLAARLRPGDVLLVRQDGFLSNAFLPGFWPHAILWLGPQDAWTALRLEDGTSLGDDPLVKRVLPRFLAATDDHGLPARAIEAVSEGVVFSSVAHALGKDHAAALRPDLPEHAVAAAIKRALTLHGRPYDFDFDFATDDRVVCTELVYRAYDPDLNFRVQVDASPAPATPVPGVIPVAGRWTMPATELARYAVFMQDHAAPDPAVRYPGRRLGLVFFAERRGAAAVVHEGEAALTALRASVER